MGRKKGSRNKVKSPSTERRYCGYFILDSGAKIDFDLTEDDGGDAFASLFDCEFKFEDNDLIYLGEDVGGFIRAKRVVGFYIDDYQSYQN